MDVKKIYEVTDKKKRTLEFMKLKPEKRAGIEIKEMTFDEYLIKAKSLIKDIDRVRLIARASRSSYELPLGPRI